LWRTTGSNPWSTQRNADERGRRGLGSTILYPPIPPPSPRFSISAVSSCATGGGCRAREPRVLHQPTSYAHWPLCSIRRSPVLCALHCALCLCGRGSSFSPPHTHSPRLPLETESLVLTLWQQRTPPSLPLLITRWYILCALSDHDWPREGHAR
jgi:hypothetical protein